MRNHIFTFALGTLSSILLLTSCNSEPSKEEKSQNSDLIAIAAPSSENSNAHYYVNASSGLSLRSGTNLKSKKILVLPYGAQVTYLGTPQHTAMTLDNISGEMVEVSYQGATGFVFNGYLTALAPPQPNEGVKEYAKRISTKDHIVNVNTKPHKEGKQYGMTTTIELPSTTWEETYKITQRLFNLPKDIKPDFNTKRTVTVLNKAKRERTLTDELTVNVGDNGVIDNLTYVYNLKNYKRSVIISQTQNGYLITEVEASK